MTKAHQIKLYPTKSQTTLLKKSCGCARYSYNWALAKWQELYKNGEKPSAYSLIKLQNSIKKTEMPFFLEVSKNAPQYAIHNLQAAFEKMWKEKKSYPKFKKKGIKDCFVSVENSQTFKQSNFKIWLPKIGWVKCAENLRFAGKVNNVTIRRRADIWFAVINIDTYPNECQIDNENQVTVGVDLGIKSMITLSDGTIFENPKALKSNLKVLSRLRRGLSRKIKGSNNRNKHKIKVARKHYKISCIRKNAIHNATSFIIKNYDRIVIEDLNVKGMIKNRSLSQAISDVSFGEVVRQLAYKAKWANKELIKADRFFASSKTCSKCGNKKEVLTLSERIFSCDHCGYSNDRDINAAINLANYSPTSKYEGSKACGEGSSIAEMQYSPSVKQEIN